MLARIAIALALVGAACSSGSSKLENGVEITLKLEPGADANRAIDLIKERIDERGLSESRVHLRGAHIVVEVPGADDQARKRLVELLQRRPALGLHLVAGMTKFMDDVCRHAKLEDPGAKAQGIAVGIDSWNDPTSDTLYADCFLAAERKDVLAHYLAAAADEVPAFQPADNLRFAYEFKRADAPVWRSYLIEKRAALDGAALAAAKVTVDPATMLPQTEVRFTSEGAESFATLVRENAGKRIAIVLGDIVNTAVVLPAVPLGNRFTIRPREAEPVVMQRAAEDTVAVLRAGMPMGVVLESSRTVGDPK